MLLSYTSVIRVALLRAMPAFMFALGEGSGQISLFINAFIGAGIGAFVLFAWYMAYGELKSIQ